MGEQPNTIGQWVHQSLLHHAVRLHHCLRTVLPPPVAVLLAQAEQGVESDNPDAEHDSIQITAQIKEIDKNVHCLDYPGSQ